MTSDFVLWTIHKHTHTNTSTFIPHTYTQYTSQSLSTILISKMPIMSTECKATVETKFVASLRDQFLSIEPPGNNVTMSHPSFLGEESGHPHAPVQHILSVYSVLLQNLCCLGRKSQSGGKTMLFFESYHSWFSSNISFDFSKIGKSVRYIKNAEITDKGLERELSSWKHLLLFHRTWD